MQAYDGSDNYSRLQRDTDAAPTEAEASGVAPRFLNPFLLAAAREDHEAWLPQ